MVKIKKESRVIKEEEAETQDFNWILEGEILGIRASRNRWCHMNT